MRYFANVTSHALFSSGTTANQSTHRSIFGSRWVRQPIGVEIREDIPSKLIGSSGFNSNKSSAEFIENGVRSTDMCTVGIESSNSMILFLCGGGLMLLSFLLKLLQWAQFARIVREQPRIQGTALVSSARDDYEDEPEEILHSHMIAAGRCLLEALERQWDLNRIASRSWNEDISSSLRDAREFVDAAANDYVRATQRFRSCRLNIRFSAGRKSIQSGRAGSASLA
jgi:hypothetical protein